MVRFKPSPWLWVLLSLCALFVWPSCYTYHAGDRLYRVHRVTNEAQVWTPELGWIPKT